MQPPWLEQACPCGSGMLYQQCCYPYHQGEQPETPEQLMRARYCAFVMGNGVFLFATHLVDTRGTLTADNYVLPSRQWLGLAITQHQIAEDGQQGWVTFKARYRENSQLFTHHERSRFVYAAHQWFYADGIFDPKDGVEKVSRNVLCPCGSGKKYKRCCGR